MTDSFDLKLMTYNIGGGRKNLTAHYNEDEYLQIIKDAKPDILGLQEATEWCTLDQKHVSQPQKIKEDVLPDHYSFFGPTLSMRQDFHIKKKIFIQGLFNDWKDWQQGNALFSRWPFVRLGDGTQPGQPENVPLYKTIYSGSRDTDPRYAILARTDLGFARVFVLVTHLTTLSGERDPEAGPEKYKQAQARREEQCERILDLTREFILKKNELLILMGDFNATPREAGILSTLETKGGFVRLVPKNSVQTHLKVEEPVDHIFIYPGNYHIEYSCEVIDNEFHASDHNPVAARISIHNSQSRAFAALGAGVLLEDPQ